jgi:hypothetical protein
MGFQAGSLLPHFSAEVLELMFCKHRLSPNFEGGGGVLLLHIIYLYVRLRGVKVVCVFIVLSYYS